MGRRFRGFRSGGGLRGGGFRSVSGGKSSAPRGGLKNLSVSQQQEDLIKDYPGTALILHRPKLGGGPRLASSSSHDEEEDYPYDYCQRKLMYYYDVVRVCGSDCTNAEGTRLFIRDACGIEVSPDVSEKKASDNVAAAAAAHL